MRERCENCRRSTDRPRYDVERVPLCPECWLAEPKATGEDLMADLMRSWESLGVGEET